MRTHFHVALPLLAAGALAAAGCGGGGGAERPLTKAQVIERGSAICKAQEAKVRALPQLRSENPFAPGAPAGEAGKARRFLAGYADALDAVRTQLGHLALPAQDRALLEGFLADLGPTVRKLREAEQAAARHDPRALALASEGFARFERASAKTAAYGFPDDVCGA